MKHVALIAATSFLAAMPVAYAQEPAQAPNPAQFSTVAPIAYLYDLSAGAVLYTKNADKRIPTASMAKIMTSHVVFDLIKQGKIKRDQKFTVRPETWEKWHGSAAGSTMFLKAGEQVSVENLLHGAITLSGNDACVVLAEGISGSEQAFVALMNEKAKALGMVNSRFGTSTGWPDQGRTYSTARDLALLGASTIRKYPEFYREFYGQRDFTWGNTIGGQAITQPNRNPILGRVAGADGIKTGHTKEAGYGFVGSAAQNGRRLVMVVAGVPSFNGRIEESVKFMNWGFSGWQAKPLFKKGKALGEAKVQLGGSSSVSLVAPRDLSAVVPIGSTIQPTISLSYDGPIKAPIAKGDEIAHLVVRFPGLAPQLMPLVAAEDVGKAGMFRRAWLGVLSFFGA